MNRSPRTVSNALFQPAIQYLSRSRTPSPHPKRSDSIDESYADGTALSRQPSNANSITGDLSTGSIPLITFSRSPSPYPRSRSSAAQSEDEDDEYDNIPPETPIFATGRIGERRTWKGWLKNGGFGAWLFGTKIGWQIYVGFLVLFVGGTGFEVVMLNRIILWTGVYKFPYPVTTTFFQFAITHILLILMASLTRALSRPLRSLGLSASIAPSHNSSSSPTSTGLRSAFHISRLLTLTRQSLLGASGIAGGGVLEFDWRVAKQVLPLAIIFVAKVVLSNLSFAYAVYPIYILSRVAILPLILTFTTLGSQGGGGGGSGGGDAQHSTATLTATLTAVLSLEMASSRPGRVIWEAIVAGIASSVFAALYPIMIMRTHRALVSAQLPTGDIRGGGGGGNGGVGDIGQGSGSSALDNPYSTHPAEDSSGTKEESRAYWLLMHYTSLLSLLVLGALVLVSGEPMQIRYHCYFMDVPWFWFLIVMAGLGGWSVFFATPLLVRATSPLSAAFVGVPRGALQLVLLSSGKMPVHSWIGVSFCWAASLWFAWVRRWEGRRLERLWLEGR